MLVVLRVILVDLRPARRQHLFGGSNRTARAEDACRAVQTWNNRRNNSSSSRLHLNQDRNCKHTKKQEATAIPHDRLNKGRSPTTRNKITRPDSYLASPKKTQTKKTQDEASPTDISSFPLPGTLDTLATAVYLFARCLLLGCPWYKSRKGINETNVNQINTAYDSKRKHARK